MDTTIEKKGALAKALAGSGAGALMAFVAWTAIVLQEGEGAGTRELLAGCFEGVGLLCIAAHLILAVVGANGNLPGAAATGWTLAARRIGGVGALGLVGGAWYLARWQVLLGEADTRYVYAEICGIVSGTVEPGIPAVAVGLLLGVAALCVHFALGWQHSTALAKRGWTRAGSWLGVLALLVGAAIVLQLATGPFF